MKKGFCYQENTHFSQAVSCGREEFWKSVRSAQTQWKIDSRRDILDVVASHDEEGIKRWLNSSDYGKFLAKKRALKKAAARQNFFDKSDEERLLAFAQELKDNLVAFIFCCYEFDATKTAKGNPFCHRRLADCHLNGLVMLDIDHVEKPLEAFEAWKKNEDLVKRTALVHITSSKQGIRFVFTADIKEGNLADNQIVFASRLGYKADQSCIDATRNSFAPKEEDILYINEELLFDYYDEDFDKEYTPKYREKETQPLFHKFNTEGGDGSAATTADSSAAIQTAEHQTGSDGTLGNEQTPVKWRGYDLQSIIDARYEKKLPCAADSNRHSESLKLATDLIIMLDKDLPAVLKVVSAQPWVREIIDERDENVEQTVKSAASCIAEKEKKYTSPCPSKAMQEAIMKVTGRSYREITEKSDVRSKTSELSANCQLSIVNSQLSEWGKEIEALMPHYPILRDVCRGLKYNQYPAAMFVAGGLMMTLMTRCSYRFYHRPEELRRLNNSTLIIGDPASGKSFATRLFKLLSVPIKEVDEEGIKAINAYREQMRTKGANKEKPKKPKVTIRIHPARTSNAQFIQDMVNSVEEVDGKPMQLHMLTFDTELDNTLSLQKGGAYIDKQSLQLKAFHNEEDGQAYSNNDSVFQNFFVIWNFIYTGTPIALKKMVNDTNFGSGLATRLTCIPLPATNFEMMSREDTIDYDSDARLTEWARKLDRMKGELTIQKIVDELYDWTARRMMDAQENDSRADEMLLKRCAYHGINFSAPFIVMRHWDKMKQDGNYWCGEFETDETDWRLAELIVNIQYACQKYYFGAMAENYFDNKLRDANVNVQRRQKTIEAFNRLPEEFTNEDVMRCYGLTHAGAARTRVKRLIEDRLAEKVKDVKEGQYYKSLYRKTGVVML